MTRQEFANLAAALKAVYQRDNFMSDKAAVEIWYKFFEDMPCEMLQKAVTEYINHETYPPTIADLKRYIDAVTGNGWSVAWNKLKSGSKLSDIDYPGQYAYNTIGKQIFDAGNDIRVMMEFQKLYKEFLLMDKAVKRNIFLSGTIIWKRKDKPLLEKNDDCR